MVNDSLERMLQRALTITVSDHDRRLQRISFAYGNTVMSYSGPEAKRSDYENKVMAAIVQQVGPCPCGACAIKSRRETREMSPAMLSALAEATKENV